MKFKFTGTMVIEVTDVEIEAKDEDEARDLLVAMSERDLLSEGAVDSYIQEVEFEVVEADYKVFIDHVAYSINEYDLPREVRKALLQQANGDEVEYDYLVQAKIQSIKESLPTSFNAELHSVKPDNIDEEAEIWISDTTGYDTAHVDVTVLETF